jgi:hypothetical protein
MDRESRPRVDKMNECMILMGKPEGNRSLGRPRRRWEESVKIDHIEEEVVWTGFIWLRIGTNSVIVNTVLNFWVT